MNTWSAGITAMRAIANGEMADIAPFLILALALLALVGVFWLMSRRGQKQQAGYAAAETLRTMDVAVVASSITIRTLLERMLSSAGIPFTFVAVTKGVTPAIPEQVRVVIVNVADARSEGVLLAEISSQRPVVFLVKPFAAEDPQLPSGPGNVHLSMPFTAPQLFLAIENAVASRSTLRAS